MPATQTRNDSIPNSSLKWKMKFDRQTQLFRSERVCGLDYSLFDKQKIAEHLHVHENLRDFVFPSTDYIRRNRETGERELVMMRWGIVPWFAKSNVEFKKLSTINAKSDRLYGKQNVDRALG
jgi:putative SOS response-associated peptidase YedK